MTLGAGEDPTLLHTSETGREESMAMTLLSAGLLTPLRVAIDLSFGHRMNAIEHRSLSQQLIRAYGFSKKAAAPGMSLHISNMATARAEFPESLPPQQHLSKWSQDGVITLLDEPASEAWRPDELVWLSPDAELPLEAPLSSSSVYVIGGLVDRSVDKWQSHDVARECGATIRRLPLQEHAPRSDVHKILSIPACVEILAKVNAGQSWASAFSAAVPKRYIARRELEQAKREESAALTPAQQAARALVGRD